MALTFMSAKGQVTYNLRLGGGVLSHVYEDYSFYHYEDIYYSDIRGGAAIVGQVNIPFTRTSTFTFSPSFALSVGPDVIHFAFPIHIGKKVFFGDRRIFFPKIGLVGGSADSNRTGILGPSAELAFELKHFVMAFNYYVGLLNEVGSHGAFATFGYKF